MMNQTQSPSTGTPAQSRPSFPPYQPPTSAEQAKREGERISLLLEINSEILERVNELQDGGQGGAMGQLGNLEVKQPSHEYSSCLKCIQCNVAWLAVGCTGGTNTPNRTSYGPLIMESPLKVPTLIEKYETLKGLFPGWKGAQQGPSRQQSLGTPPQGQMQQTSTQQQGQIRPQPGAQTMVQQQEMPPQSMPPQQTEP